MRILHVANFNLRKYGADLCGRLTFIDVVFATTGGEPLRKYVTPSTYDYDFIFCGQDQNDLERRDFRTTLYLEASKYLRCAFPVCLGKGSLTAVAIA